MTSQERADRRERIAIAAMAAIISKHPATTIEQGEEDDLETERAAAAGAVAYADALIEALDE